MPECVFWCWSITGKDCNIGWMLWILQGSGTQIDTETRKLRYCKDDRMMRPVYGCPENFRESLSIPAATFAEIFNGLLFRLILWICVQNVKFVALPITEIIGGTQKFGQSWISPCSLFFQICNGLLFRWTLWMYQPNLQSIALPIPEIIVIAGLGWGCEPSVLGKGRP